MAGIEKAVFMNMCMVYDEHGRVLALDKVSKSYEGTTFPGGHVEPGETFRESVIREIRGRDRADHSKSEVDGYLSLDGRQCAECGAPL